MLAQLDREFSPKTIALAMDGSRGVTRGLTHATYQLITEALGPEATTRFVSAADLIEEDLDTRIPEEQETYTTLVRLTDEITKRALSNEVITPGKFPEIDMTNVGFVCLCYLTAPSEAKHNYVLRRISSLVKDARVISVAWSGAADRVQVQSPANAISLGSADHRRGTSRRGSPPQR